MPTANRAAKRLTEAAESATLVRITRSPRNADRVDGFVLSVGAKWVLLSKTGDGGYFDGLVAVRLEHVVKIAEDSTFETRFARTQPEWPPTAPAVVDLDSTKRLVETLSPISPLIGIEQEGRSRSAMTWIGAVDEIDKGWLWLQEVRPNAKWRKQPRGYELSRITKVIVSDRYQTALTAIARTRP